MDISNVFFSFVLRITGTRLIKSGFTKTASISIPYRATRFGRRFVKYIVDNFKGTNSLIVLDDCASTQAVKNRVSELVKLGFSARHYGFSTIVITQQLTSIAKPYRENIAKLVTFYNPSKKDMQTITDEFLNAEKNEIKDIVQKLKNNKYARLEILLRSPYTHEVIVPFNKR